jgi:hypothetical protein
MPSVSLDPVTESVEPTCVTSQAIYLLDLFIHPPSNLQKYKPLSAPRLPHKMESTSTSAPADPKPPKDYSSEPEIYGVRYNHVSMMLSQSFPADSLANDTTQLMDLYGADRFDECRKACLELLAEPDLSLFTRIQTLQVAATVSQPARTAARLDEAASLLEQMDADMWQVRFLKANNDKRLGDLVDWIKANGMVGLPLEMLARRELEGPHGPGCMCDEVEKTDDACTFVTSAARTKEGK